MLFGPLAVGCDERHTGRRQITTRRWRQLTEVDSVKEALMKFARDDVAKSLKVAAVLAGTCQPPWALKGRIEHGIGSQAPMSSDTCGH